MSEPRVLTFEDFAGLHDAGLSNLGDAGLHNPAGHMPQRTWARFVKAQAAKDHALLQRRAELQAEYNRLVEAGEIRPPSALESLKKRACGHSDNESVQAARRLLMRRFGIDYKTLEGYKPT